MPIHALARTSNDLLSQTKKPGEEACSVPLTAESVHDLSGPINQLCSMTELILSKHKDELDPETELLFGFVRNSADRLQALLEGLKVYFEVMEAAGPYRLCSAEDLLRGALTQLLSNGNAAGAVVTHDPLPELVCDPNQITFVLASVLDNAVKFRGRESPHIHVTAASTPQTWALSLRDNGIGIDPRHHKAVFDVFKRVHKDSYPGAGMGLAIAKRIMERHNGNIRIESAPDEGTTVIIELPRIGGAAGTSAR